MNIQIHWKSGETDECRDVASAELLIETAIVQSDTVIPKRITVDGTDYDLFVKVSLEPIR